MQKFIMRPQRDLLAKLMTVLMLLFVVGCSAVRIGYANGETVLYWWLDGYVDFQNEQKPWVRQHIANLLAWHRKTQLRDYAQVFARMQQQVRGNVTPADVLNMYAAIKQRARTTLEHALPQLTDLAMAMTPAQIDHLEAKFASNNEKYRKDYLHGDLEYRQDFRFRKVMKQAEYWFGDFSAQQEARIRAASNARPLNNELWMAERVRRQQGMISLLRKIHAEHLPREAVTAMLRDYLAQSLDIITYNDHKEFFDNSGEGMARMVATIVNIATPEQREHALKRLQKWIEDCNSLAAK
jgi:hypothetical protein